MPEGFSWLLLTSQLSRRSRFSIDTLVKQSIIGTRAFFEVDKQSKLFKAVKRPKVLM
jgi:hypothetical protein